MSTPGQAQAARLRQLLEVVDQDREKRCAELLDQAHAEAERVVRQARQKTRARLHHEVLQSREQYRSQLRLEQANNAARRRQARERADCAWLAQAWQPLQEALVGRWQAAEDRALWIEALVHQAMMRLVDRDWQIEHPSNWPEAEQQQLTTRLQAALGEAPVLVADPALSAGLRVRAGDTVVDGTCAGLLRDRTHIEALLLAGARARDTGNG
jgi:hypothetical protein